MLKFIKQYRWWILSALMLVAAIRVIAASQSLQECVSNYKSPNSNNPTNTGFSIFETPIKNSVSCGWDSLGKNSDALIALFTIIIGFFTAMLFLDGKEKGRKELRAYMVVNINSGRYQDTTKNPNIKFEITPLLMNVGKTPAHNMRYWATAEIHPFPLPENFRFPHPDEQYKMSMVMGPGQSIVINAFVNDLVPDTEVPIIKKGITKRVHIWGVVTYDDIFGKTHKTKFCHSISWYSGPSSDANPAGEYVNGHYSYRYNEAT